MPYALDFVEADEGKSGGIDKRLIENGHFSRLPAAAVFDGRVSAATLRILAALAVYADRDGICWPSTTTLGRGLGCTRQNVRYHIKKLERTKYVWVERRKRGNGMNEVNRYHISYPPLDQSAESRRG